MASIKQWPLWAKALFVAFVAYSGLLLAVSLSTFVEALRHGWQMHTIDIAFQILTALFLPILLVALRSTRLASGLLFAAAAGNLVILVAASSSVGDGAGAMLVGSLFFLGIPLLGAAAFLHRLSRSQRSAE